ncbi:MAG: efflux RND transporter periplasmic adaptor subunit [Candidatus Kaiserbacteria bacterium]|nr:efflux RND transporter periplasmic adaptor subunit [Candidatus Kaiserbacteria bacterium]
MLNRLYDRYGVSFVRRAIAGIGILVAVIVFFIIQGTGAPTVTEEERNVPEVALSAVKDFGNESSFSIVGTVRAVSEANLQAEAGGRITSVFVSIGDPVNAGTVLGTIENSAEYASLLQAQGAYDSALASNLQSNSSLEEMKVKVRNTYRDTFSTAEDVIRNLTDDFFQNPTSKNRGFRLGGAIGASQFNEDRGEIEIILTTWSDHIATNYEGMSETDMLRDAESGIVTINDFTARLALIIADYDANTYFTKEKLAVYKTRLAGARASLDGALASISVTRSAYNQALISASPDTASQSSALLKSALGALRGAQANYEKTIVRTPISGTVNALYLKQGEYISAGQPAGIVASNGSLEITTAVGEKDLEYIKIGDAVRINNTASGTVTRIAPAIDPNTGKSEVKISTDASLTLKNGSTVSITLSHKTNDTKDTTVMVIPLKALKMLASGSLVFSVSNTQTLISHPVTLGALRGDSVEIVSGLTPDSIIVTDARGLKEGDTVSVTSN